MNLEQHVLEFWEEMKLHQCLMQKNKGNTRFVFYDGPITANNPMGVHHAWGRTYKDLVQRQKAMLGFDLRFQNGFDTQGLWVEVEVEKALGLASKRDTEQLGVANFVGACKERVQKYSRVQTAQSKRLGQTMDWSNSYFTHTDENASAIWHFLKTCHERGWLYKGMKPMPWCVRCGTSLSNHELADSYRELTHAAPFVKFQLLDQPASLLVWTTTPWTLPANLAVAVHPTTEYGRFRTRNGEVLVASSELRHGLLKDAELLELFPGSDLEGQSYRSPFAELQAQPEGCRRVFLWDEVSADEGTGVVHLAPGCGAEDYEFGQKHGLGALVPLDEHGAFVAGFGKMTRMSFSDGNEFVLSDLKHKGFLFHTQQYKHRYPVCWRCGEELVFRLVDEWFLSCDEVRPLMQEAAAGVSWHPSHVGKLFQDWLVNMGDWCVSRKRYWGLPLPFYECSCGHLNVLGSKDEFLERAVGDVDKVKELHRPWVDLVAVTCEKCGNAVDRVTEVGDCWLDAGAVPFSTTGYFHDKDYWKKWFPAELVCEMREQVRLWFYATMFMSVTLEGTAPYKSVCSYEKVLDKHGAPMHKSHGNAVWFDDAVEQLGADTMRLMYLSHNPALPLRFDLDAAHAFAKPLLQLWNMLRFLCTFADLDELQVAGVQSDHWMDKWMLSELDAYVTKTAAHFSDYEFQSLADALVSFLDEVSNWYLRRSRRRFWRQALDEDKQGAFETLHDVLMTLARVMAPVVPFAAELVYQALKHYVPVSLPDSVHLCEFPQSMGRFDTSASQEMKSLRKLVSMGMTLRNNQSMRVRQPLAEFSVWSTDPVVRSTVKKRGREIGDELNVKAVKMLASVDTHLNYSLLPNYSRLGPKLGKRLPQVRKMLEAVPSQQAKQWYDSNGASELRFGDNMFLDKDDVLVHAEATEGFVSVSEGDLVVFLDTRLTVELRNEGFVRDFVRQVQSVRKQLDLPVDAKVCLKLETTDTLWNTLEDKRDFVFAETQAVGWQRFSKTHGLNPEDLDTEKEIGTFAFEFEDQRGVAAVTRV